MRLREFKEIQKRLGLTNRDLALVTRTGIATINRITRGATPVSPHMHVIMKLLDRVGVTPGISGRRLKIAKAA